jgi:hypothetical protein
MRCIILALELMENAVQGLPDIAMPRTVTAASADDELKHRMNMDNCAAQRFSFVERFNAVTTTDCSGLFYADGNIPENHCHEGRIRE